jgi:hypothetical protein
MEVRVDVVNGTSAVHSRGNAIPAAVDNRSGGYADPLDGFAVRGFPGLVCNEQAFQYLLEIERRRSENTRRAFLLTLIDSDDLQAAAPGHPLGPDRLFPIVCKSVRETDFVGWYRQGAVVGATLTQDGRKGAKQASGIVRDRIVKALHEGLPSELASRVRLRLYEVLGDDAVRIE